MGELRFVKNVEGSGCGLKEDSDQLFGSG